MKNEAFLTESFFVFFEGGSVHQEMDRAVWQQEKERMKKNAVRIPVLMPSKGDHLVESGDRQQRLSETDGVVSGPASKTIRPGRPVRRIVRAVMHELDLVCHRF